MSPAAPYSTIDVPGIYLITHIASGKVYVGSTSRSIGDRWTQHRWDLRRNIHGNAYLQRAWNKYGEDAFSVTVAEFVSDPDLVIEREQEWIDRYIGLGRDKCYNIAPLARSSRGIKRTPEQCAAIGALKRGVKQSPETIERRANAARGKKRSIEVRARLSEIAKRRAPMSDETRKKISESLKGRKRSPEAIAAQTKTYEGFISPDGTVYTNVTNLQAFIQEHGLGNALYRVERGLLMEYKGWRRIPPIRVGRNIRVFAFIDPDGVRHDNITNLKNFCEAHGLNAYQMSMVYREKLEHHRQWRKAGD